MAHPSLRKAHSAVGDFLTTTSDMINYVFITGFVCALIILCFYLTLHELKDMRDYIFDVNRKADRALDENKILRMEIDRLTKELEELCDHKNL